MKQIEVYREKEDQYYGVEQAWVAELIEGRNLHILDIGCGDGATGAMLKQRSIASELHGIELIESAAERARAYFDSVLVGDIETLNIPYEPDSFDVIIMTEVLEHLVNPWQVVRRMLKYLCEGGYIIASTPNVQNAKVVWQLLGGRWDYQDQGILDKTHLRFFTRESFAELFVQAGLHIDMVGPIMHHRLEYVNRWTLKVFEGFLTHRYKCRAIKRTSG